MKIRANMRMHVSLWVPLSCWYRIVIKTEAIKQFVDVVDVVVNEVALYCSNLCGLFLSNFQNKSVYLFFYVLIVQNKVCHQISVSTREKTKVRKTFNQIICQTKYTHSMEILEKHRLMKTFKVSIIVISWHDWYHFQIREGFRVHRENYNFGGIVPQVLIK